MLKSSNWPPVHVYSGMWIGLPREKKLLIAEKFGIKPSTATHVSDGVVISDGYSDKDLSVITVESLQNVLNSKETDLFKLWHEYLASLDASMKPEVVPEKEEKPAININLQVVDGEIKVVDDKPKKKNATKTKTTAQNEGTVTQGTGIEVGSGTTTQTR